jgi:hypothetical protein
MIASVLSNKGQKAMLAGWMQMSQLMTAAALPLFAICVVLNPKSLLIWIHETIGWNRWDDVACEIYYFPLVSLFHWYEIIIINKKTGINRYTS